MNKLLKVFYYALAFFIFGAYFRLLDIYEIILLKLLFGWMRFIEFNLSRIELNIDFLVSAIICLIALTIIINLASKKLVSSQWKWQWSVIVTVSPMLLFIIALASIGFFESCKQFYSYLYNL